mmetsp:Transcript_7332/g.10488  ORF Transcript_7332/g.10488 Transcript_7332/m.10488 type:complete len:287 (-) Transcript_7332:340-1200(-)|eukprot:CAMPEP_0184865790 /NCGR_PEP_ID=MMETSP0580-20130426/19094_1 /TAXON_ID=1118495 /ORGANISM="Dactyliosolen fragilissimus" /LENGTH=286 /DNA_ID=CAMNT_0027365113 /DNA_START=35 /DNA_END=895 /DNA_ORIENTATION=+
MSITYEEALSTLTSMFGEPWTEESLDAVLRHHEGHMENTVESVLSHGDSPPNLLVQKLQNSQQITNEQTALDERLARQLANEGQGAPPPSRNIQNGNVSSGLSSISPSAAATGVKKGRGAPTELPPDFLRIPDWNNSGIDDDEKLARMLQDELFSQELKNNPEFAHLARGRSSNSGRGGGNQVKWGSNSRFPGRPPNRSQDGPGIVDALSDLGENAKKRLSLLAARFNKNRNKNETESTGGLGGSSGSSEKKGLLDEDEEISFRESTDFEMKSISSSDYRGNKKID